MGYQRYQQMDVETASPTALVVKLYEGAIRNAQRALESHQAGRVGDRGAAISRAMAIVSELSSALDMERGGEIASNLSSLYGFVNEQLLEANVQGRADGIEGALRVLRILSEAWVEVARSAPAGAASSPEAP